MIIVIDGQGGRLGSEIIKRIKLCMEDDIYAFGTNAIATDQMIKNGAKKGGTGEYSIKCYSKKADIIIGPIGIVIPGALMGEITPDIAESISNSSANKFLIAFKHDDFYISSLKDQSLIDSINEIVEKIKELKC